MIKNIFILPVFLLPSVTDAGDCVAVSLYCTESEAVFSISRQEPIGIGNTKDFVSRHIKLLGTLKLKKNIPGSSNRSLYGSPAQFMRPAKNLAPTKTITGRIPSAYPTNVLRI